VTERRLPFPRRGEQLADLSGPRRVNALPGRSVTQGGRTGVFRTRVYRCSGGHLFRLSWWSWIRTNTFIPWVRLGFAAYGRCPAGKHWSLVRIVSEARLTEQERQILERQPPIDIYEGERLNSAIGVSLGVFSLVMAIVTQRWWLAGLCALWVAFWGAVLVHASRRMAIEQRRSRRRR
jgi:hypothetical protein